MKLLNIYKKNFNSKVFFFILFFDDIRIIWFGNGIYGLFIVVVLFDIENCDI